MSGIGGHERTREGATDHWLTPPDLLAKLGAFDLDPCAAPEPRPWPTATRHLTDCGLEQPWAGRVWLNPPYGPRAGLWLRKLAEHGDGIALVFARTDTAWFQAVVPDCDAILFLSGRIAFHHADGSRGTTNAGAPSCMLAFGDRNVEALGASGLHGFFAMPLPR